MTTWRERIQAARERGEFTAEDRIAAVHWTTCAVGEQAERGLIAPVVASYDDVWTDDSHPLNAPGLAFYDAVRVHDFARAELLLDAIEDRALVLKREIRERDGVSPERPQDVTPA